MRTTVTLSPEADEVVRALMRERGLSFKDAINDAILAASPRANIPAYELPSLELRPRVPLDDITVLLSALDDDEFARKRETGK